MVLIIAGEGGHFEQMLRLNDYLLNNFSAVQILGITDSSRESDRINLVKVVNISKISKSSKIYSKLGTILILLYLFAYFLFFFIRNKPSSVLLLGPMIAVPAAFASKVLGIKCAFIESWSRFESPTKTGKIALMLGIPYYYQNLSLGSKLGSDGEYVGRL